ncbi:hypothetical protein K458DRAFT_304781 [Lentithecium fluviatile CBS 122367]|uniref:Rhodopsin domain-containing protein n=1 Tax=Lentithecium fluviatile CBS 122367 TaxID=1168545 RepID=A0A6G1IZB3_9PLEO|nr:hypothetical protein K458DRAFT_304781 [Lentithecium fluviatile CBS 122367]
MAAALAQMPAMAPPPGVESNLINPESIGYRQTITTSILLAIMMPFVFNRIYVKVWLVRKISWDDGTLLVGFLGTLLHYATYEWAAKSGNMGKHMWDVSVLAALSPDLMVPSYILTVSAPPTFGFLKCTFFILYLQLFFQLTWMRICSIIGLILTGAFYTAFTIVMFYFSTPRPGELFMPRDTAKTTKIILPIAIAGLVIDVAILVLPIAAVSQLKASPKKKFAATLVFLTGLMACVSSAVGLYYRSQIHADGDVTYELVPSNIATAAEMMIGVMCACMPSVAYSYRHVPALQGFREKLSPKISALVPSTIFKSRQSTLPTIRITDKSASSGVPSHLKEAGDEIYYRLADYNGSDKSVISRV